MTFCPLFSIFLEEYQIRKEIKFYVRLKIFCFDLIFVKQLVLQTYRSQHTLDH